jgi:pantetheine-phosphate adenylyltransferase
LKKNGIHSKFCAEFPNVEVDSFEGLTVDYCFEKNAIHHQRTEILLILNLKKQLPTPTELYAHKKLETVFLLTSSGKSFISSSIVRKLFPTAGEYRLMVPDSVGIEKINKVIIDKR